MRLLMPAHRVVSSPCLELLAPVNFNIVCFRYNPPSHPTTTTANATATSVPFSDTICACDENVPSDSNIGSISSTSSSRDDYLNALNSCIVLHLHEEGMRNKSCTYSLLTQVVLKYLFQISSLYNHILLTCKYCITKKMSSCV